MRYFKAFSLLEACFLIMLMGIIIGGITPLVASTLRYKRQLTTQRHEQEALMLLGFYAAQTHQLPRPQGGGLPHQIISLPERQTRDGDDKPLSYEILLKGATTPSETFCGRFRNLADGTAPLLKVGHREITGNYFCAIYVAPWNQPHA